MTDLAWLEWRRVGLGASDVAAIVGLSPWTSRWALWADKTGLIPPDDSDSEAMEFGRRFEGLAVPWFAERRPGLVVAGQQQWCTHSDHLWARCTVDGFVFKDGEPTADALGTFEVKTDHRHGPDAWETEIPAHYQCQAQWQMYVTGMQRTWFAVLHTFGRFRIYELVRDEADIALLVAAASTFWDDHVLTGIPPVVDGSEATTAALAQAWRDPAGAIEVDPALLDAVTAATAALKAAKDADTEARNRLRAALGDRTDATVDGRLVASWRPQTSARIDADRLRALHPEIATEVTTTTESRVLRLHN